jgi:hypothetical protein
VTAGDGSERARSHRETNQALRARATYRHGFARDGGHEQLLSEAEIIDCLRRLRVKHIVLRLVSAIPELRVGSGLESTLDDNLTHLAPHQRRVRVDHVREIAQRRDEEHHERLGPRRVKHAHKERATVEQPFVGHVRDAADGHLVRLLDRGLALRADPHRDRAHVQAIEDVASKACAPPRRAATVRDDADEANVPLRVHDRAGE